MLLVFFLQIVLKELLESGYLHGDQKTVNGKTLRQNLQDVPRITDLTAQVWRAYHGSLVRMVLFQCYLRILFYKMCC